MKVHTLLRGSSALVQHMLGCVAEATFTACLTAASVCYWHGPVSTHALLSLPVSTSPLCLLLSSLSYLCHFLHAHLPLVLLPLRISPSVCVKHNHNQVYCYYRAAMDFPILSLNCLFLILPHYCSSLCTSSLPGLSHSHPCILFSLCVFGFSGPSGSSMLG